jgi:L-2-hydroxycarboxylate dehydrogenase (NAD+)
VRDDATPAREDVLVDARSLEAFVTALFEGGGMESADAGVIAACLVQTDLWGKESHGVMRAPHYMRRLRNGAVNPRPRITTLRGDHALEVLHGDDGPGFIVGRQAMQRAADLALESNVGVVGVTRSNHFGAAALYARLAVDAGMVGIAMTNTTPKLLAPGGARPITGSNALAIGIPTFGEFPFMLDISMSALAGGKLLLASKRGEKIPLGLAMDKEGRPTDDAAAAFSGSWLPMGGVKGLGLSYAVDILCGVITGGAFGLGMKSQFSQPDQPSETGHMMIAMNVEAIIGRDELKERMATFCSAVKASPMRDSSSEMMIPGEMAHRTEVKRRAEGIPLPASVYEELLALGDNLRVPSQLAARQRQ